MPRQGDCGVGGCGQERVEDEVGAARACAVREVGC